MRVKCHRLFFLRKEYLLSTLLTLPWTKTLSLNRLLGYSNERIGRFGDGAHFEWSEDIFYNTCLLFDCVMISMMFRMWNFMSAFRKYTVENMTIAHDYIFEEDTVLLYT